MLLKPLLMHELHSLNSAVEAKIPSLTGYATETYVTNAISANTGLTENGGTLKGGIVIDRADLSVPSFDFSRNHWDSQKAQKYQTNCPHVTRHYSTFGTNDNLYEYAWSFYDNEDFCWVHGDNGKVVSIDRNGLAAHKLYLADFGTNTADGRTLAGTIDVGAQLTANRNALASLRINAASATTLDELKTAISNALANL